MAPFVGHESLLLPPDAKAKDELAQLSHRETFGSLQLRATQSSATTKSGAHSKSPCGDSEPAPRELLAHQTEARPVEKSA